MEKIEAEHFRKRIQCDIYYYSNKIIHCNKRLMELDEELTSISSIRYDDVTIENKRDSYSHRLNWSIEEEEKIIKEREEYVSIIESYKEIFDRLPFYIQVLIAKLYICKYNHDDVAEEIGYTKRSMYRLINRELCKVVI